MSVHTAYWPTLSWPTMTRLWQSLLAHLEMSEEPRVWRGLDQAGNPAWNAYDPVTGQSVRLVSEAELRTVVSPRNSDPITNVDTPPAALARYA